MNIFLLDKNLEICATYHCNKHIISQIKESCQLLSTAHRVLDGKLIDKKWIHPDKIINDIIYKATHINHPSAIWARQSKANYLFLFELLSRLSEEYTYRYNKIHASTRLFDVLKNAPINISNNALTDVPQCMPDYCKLHDTVEAYRNYYKLEKRHIAIWKNRDVPYWYD
jgi:aminopeptidase-like protein